MISLIKALNNESGFLRIAAAVESGACPALVTGVSRIHRSHIAAALRRRTGRPMVVLCPDDGEAKRMAADVAAFTEEAPYILTARDFTFYNAAAVSRQSEHDRIRALYAMLCAKAPIVVASAEAILQRTMPPEVLEKTGLEIKMGGEYAMEQVVDTLVHAGYSRSEQVEGCGQFAVRGGILDFFSPAHDEPVRCEFFGDEIDSLSFFDALTQRRTDSADKALILPAAETLPMMHPAGAGGLCKKLDALRNRIMRRKTVNTELIDNITADIDVLEQGATLTTADRYMDMIYPMATAADYFAPDSLIFFSEPIKISGSAQDFVKRQAQDVASLVESGVIEGGAAKYTASYEAFCLKAADYPIVMADSFTGSKYPFEPRTLESITAKQLPSYKGSFETAAGDISHYIGTGFSTVVLCSNQRRGEAMQSFLAERGVKAALDFNMTELPVCGTCSISIGLLSTGMEYPNSKLAVITEGQIADSVFKKKKRKKQKTNREKLNSYADLSAGDLVVHDVHGIGRYMGMVKIPVDGIEKDYVKIAYAGADCLYVPATQLDMVAKYIGGGEDKAVRLSKMGGADWQRVKAKAKGAAKEMARELLQLYAERRRTPGHAFAADSIWQTEFDAGFEYRETDDQLRCIEEIKRDMESSVPMDRLLCGDVGYGKTEVALRAVMKCVLDGRQAAILVPTTVLAQQHYVTAVRRFAGYPVTIEVLSRFRTAAEIKKAIKGAESGTVDIIIGTHRLFQKDIKFKALGLLVVDEEQRFGVTHKERLKEMSKQVDVLTLSATPIPRTLNMALSGIRDMSTIEEPPRDRQPVQTYVMEHDWGVIGDAIRREVSRGGQVYYLHNRVDTIERTAKRLREMIEGLTVGVAHGKMDEDGLSDVMERMSDGELNVLVCTTIIETGIDIPNVNTLIIEDADNLGLAQLHQLRGRVGRSSRRAFAYLTYRQGKVLTEVAEKRLEAIREFAEFNSGFKIAMRDLEIRGAGNLLGAEQSGHMVSVGYDMYLRLLEEAVLEESGQKPEVRTDCSADFSVKANIPDAYVPSAEQRMDLYRRIAAIRTEEDSDEMIAELIDRYGDPPSAVITLVNIALLRGVASKAGITDISQKSGWLKLTLSQFDMQQVSALYSMPEYKNRVKIEAGDIPVVALRLKTARIVDEAMAFVRAYDECAEK